MACLFYSCEEMVDLDPPANQLVRQEVFKSEATVESAMTGIYYQLFQLEYSNGGRSSITTMAGLSADNIQTISTGNVSRMQFQEHEIDPDNIENLSIWSSAYNMIYAVNSFLEGLQNADNLEQSFKNQMEGQARFVRAFTYFYLTNLYGDVPLILKTDYRENQLASRTSQIDIYDQILADLIMAEEQVPEEYWNTERTSINKQVVRAFLSRVYLYSENWQEAEKFSSLVINDTGNYGLLEDLDEVFLANSAEAIWQISPIGAGGLSTQTNEGNFQIIDPIFSFFAAIKLEEPFIAEFDSIDKRFQNWVGYNEALDAHYVHKYKVRLSNQFPIEEYSMVLRLGEQYLIRAESRLEQGDLAGALQDVDEIRLRSGLQPFAEIKPEISEMELFEEILLQRRKELFSEWSHRWFDLKRTGQAGQVLGEDPSWNTTDLLYPIPESERKKNPNLTQNEGY
ncbi:RagB/SusD family nutrient uptake outer membrane protein [Salegentibacter sp. BDJ18]|uniref:RagB/SusD family nutrient uptake outer membrane protein n=2 Tax=unclassified Salegentibacter TaxID=2633436 RepID=UPI0031FA0770